MSLTDFQSQHPGSLPPTVKAYRSTAVFTAETLPAGLRRDHATKAGVWALIHVLEGRLRYCVESWNYQAVLEAGQTDIVAPQVVHFVEPLGDVRMFVEFYAQPEVDAGEPHTHATGVFNEPLQG